MLYLEVVCFKSVFKKKINLVAGEDWIGGA